MTEINADAVQLVKKAAKEKFGTDVTDNEASKQSWIILTRRYRRRHPTKSDRGNRRVDVGR
jgi:hypothetical protein